MRKVARLLCVNLGPEVHFRFTGIGSDLGPCSDFSFEGSGKQARGAVKGFSSLKRDHGKHNSSEMHSRRSCDNL